MEEEPGSVGWRPSTPSSLPGHLHLFLSITHGMDPCPKPEQGYYAVLRRHYFIFMFSGTFSFSSDKETEVEFPGK